MTKVTLTATPQRNGMSSEIELPKQMAFNLEVPTIEYFNMLKFEKGLIKAFETLFDDASLYPEEDKDGKMRWTIQVSSHEIKQKSLHDFTNFCKRHNLKPCKGASLEIYKNI